MVLTVNVDNIGDKAKIARIAKHWSQTIVALIAHTSQVTVSRLERNLPVDEGEKQKILKALEIPEGE